MKILRTVLFIALLITFSSLAFAAPADLVGKIYTPAFAAELNNQYGPAVKTGTDNKHGFVYFNGADFTLAVLIHNNVIVKVIDGSI